MDKFELIKDWEGGKVCSIASHEDKLYLGGSDGKIYLYNIEQKASTVRTSGSSNSSST